MEKEYDFTVSFSYYEDSESKQASVEIKAKNEAEALEKAKIKYSVHSEGKNYQPIAGALIMRK